MSNIITLSAYITGCTTAFAITLNEIMKVADDYAEILVGLIISVITGALSWLAVGCFILYSIIKKRKHGE